MDQKTLNALAKGAGITAIAMFVSKIITYFYRLVIARFVGPEAYGQLSLALMVIGIGGTLGLMSLNSGLQKFIPEFRTKNEKAKIKGLVLSSLYLAAPLSLVITLSIFFGAEFIAMQIFESPNLVSVLKVMAVGPLLGSLSAIFFDTTVGYNKIIYKSCVQRVLQNVVQLGATALLVAFGYGVIGAAWGWVAGASSATLLGFYFMEKKVGPILFSKIKPEYQHVKLLSYSYPLLLSGLINVIMGWTDTGFLGYYMTDSEVGLYNAALPTAMLILLPHKAIGSLAVSSFSELNQRNETGIEDALQTATRWVFALVFPTFLMLILFSEQIMHILWGAQYTGASVALSILAFGYVIDTMIGRVGSLLQSKGYTKYILYNNLIALILNLLLNIALIPIYGITGAAIATASSTVLAHILMFIDIWKKEKIISMPHREIAKIIFIGLLPLTAIIGFDSALLQNTSYWLIFPTVLVYGLIYLSAYLKIIGLGEEEKEVFLRIGELTGSKERITKLIEHID